MCASAFLTTSGSGSGNNQLFKDPAEFNSRGFFGGEREGEVGNAPSILILIHLLLLNLFVIVLVFVYLFCSCNFDFIK